MNKKSQNLLEYTIRLWADELQKRFPASKLTPELSFELVESCITELIATNTEQFENLVQSLAAQKNYITNITPGEVKRLQQEKQGLTWS